MHGGHDERVFCGTNWAYTFSPPANMRTARTPLALYFIAAEPGTYIFIAVNPLASRSSFLWPLRSRSHFYGR